MDQFNFFHFFFFFTVKLIIYDSNSAILEEKIEHFNNFRDVIYTSLFNNFYVGGGTTFSNSKKSHLHHLHLKSRNFLLQINFFLFLFLK